MKVLIAIQGIANSGKSAIIKRVSKELQTDKYGFELFEQLHENRKDIWEILKKGKTKIGLVSEGDIALYLDDYLERLNTNNCDYIICACRSRGDTVKSILKYKSSYNINWIRIEHTKELSEKQYNDKSIKYTGKVLEIIIDK